MDSDLIDRARDDFSLFAKILNVELFDWQMEFGAAQARHKTAVCGRRAGKTFIISLISTWWAIRRRDQQVVIVSGTEDGARRTLEQIAVLCRDHPWLGAAVTAELRESITFSNGSRINAVPGRSEASVRGWRAVHLAVWDEASLIPMTTWRAGSPMTRDQKDAQVLIAGTPGGGHGHFLRALWERGMAQPDAYARSWNVPSTANPAVRAEDIEEDCKMWGEDFVAQEYEARWVDEAGLVWTRDQIYGCVADVQPFTVANAVRHSLMGEDWWGDPRRDRRFRCVAGLDFGKQIDSHAWYYSHGFALGSDLRAVSSR